MAKEEREKEGGKDRKKERERELSLDCLEPPPTINQNNFTGKTVIGQN